MRWGLYVPTAGAFGDPRSLVAIARAAENGGWDGMFLWDVLPGDGRRVVDPMTTLAAAAAVTSRLRLGTLVTPLGRRRPWQLALEVQTLSRLSDGRFIL